MLELLDPVFQVYVSAPLAVKVAELVPEHMDAVLVVMRGKG